jgi:hypothetical protein
VNIRWNGEDGKGPVVAASRFHADNRRDHRECSAKISGHFCKDSLAFLGRWVMIAVREDRRPFRRAKERCFMHRKSVVGIALFGSAFIAAPALAGPEWIEQGDAGRLVGTAQKTFGEGNLTSIAGSMSLGFGVSDFEDMYLISVLDPDNFSIAIHSIDFDSQLFIFNVTLPGQAFGLLANDDTSDGFNPLLTSMATDSTGAGITAPGIYAIAISGSGRNPVSSTGEIFFYGNPTEISGADGPGGINPHIDWTGDGSGGSYVLTLTGAGFYDVPTPGALALLGLAALVGRRRARRR